MPRGSLTLSLQRQAIAFQDNPHDGQYATKNAITFSCRFHTSLHNILSLYPKHQRKATPRTTNTQVDTLTMAHRLLYLYTTLLTLLTLALALPQNEPEPSIFIAALAIWGSPNNELSNKTFAFPIERPWKHSAFAGLDTIYLIGAKGDVDYKTVQCRPYWTKPNGMGYSGLWLSAATPTKPRDIAADLRDASLTLDCRR